MAQVNEILSRRRHSHGITKRIDVLAQDLTKTRSGELWGFICRIALKPGTHLIACNPPVSHITADARSPMRSMCTLKWPLQCLLNHITEWLKTFIRRPSLEDVFSFINVWRTISIQVLNLHDFFCIFWLCPSIHILEIYLKKWPWYWEIPFRDMKSVGTKQTKIKDKANCGGPLEAVIHIQQQLNYHVQNLVRPPPHDIEIGHPCIRDVNAMSAADTPDKIWCDPYI